MPRLLALAAALAAFSGCGLQPACPDSTEGPRQVVLTFDDGPIATDVADPASASEPDLLLAPLNDILANLRRRGVRAVFYVKGPGDPATGEKLKASYAKGFDLIRQDGHVLGYHAYRQALDIWVEPAIVEPLVRERMSEDLHRLALFLDEVLAPAGLSQEEVFTPIFRPPYGGAVVSMIPAWIAACGRGWVDHGYRIDSVDWTTNADVIPQLVARLPVATEADHVKFVRRRLREGVTRFSGHPSVDVLLHVNAFTAAHLDEWFDELTTAFDDETGLPPSFGVTDEYLSHEDPFVDESIVRDLLRGP